MKDDKENDIEMNNGDSAEAPADENNMQANPESEKKPHNRKVIAAICGLALVALIGGGAYYGISHQTGADSKAESVQANDSKESDGKADEHIKQTGHSGYSTNVPITDEVMVSEGYDKQVTDTPAYDETVIDKLVCTTCGATKDAPQATSDAAK